MPHQGSASRRVHARRGTNPGAHGGAVATGIMQENKRDTRGLTREQRATNRSKKRGDSDSSIATGITTCRRTRRRKTYGNWMLPKVMRFQEKWDEDKAAYEEQFGCHDLPDRVVSDTPYQEKPFGEFFEHEGKWGAFIARAAPRLPDQVVSLALFDGDEMLFACSGVALPDGFPEHVTRFLTSAHLVREFMDKRNKDDELRVVVRLPDNTTVNGFLGLYDDHIAIVMCFSLVFVRPVQLDCVSPNLSSLRTVMAFGRAFNSGRLMVQEFSLLRPDPIVNDIAPRKVFFPDFTEAALGGPLIDANGYFLGVIHHHDHNMQETWSLPETFLRQRLEHFGIFQEEGEDYDAGSLSGGNKKSRRKYSLPPRVSRVVPSGFMRTFNWLKFMGYPIPPPLVLEVNGKLYNHFEEEFGEVSAWEGYFESLWFLTEEYVWDELPKKVFTDISRRAVSVTSFNGNKRFFACTGLLISWHARTRTHTRTRTRTRTGTRTRSRSVILTSASLVRTRDDDDKIDRNLRIEVFLPPHQRADGTLELYHSNYNIALISVEKHFLAARPENIFSTVQKPSKNVVAIGRAAAEGLLFASMGEVTDKPREEPSELDCEDLKLSTCKIKKVGIGGPLIRSDDGSFVGMNFYDDTDKTPFLPRSKIVDVLKGIDLPSERGLNCPVNMMDDAAVTKNRWPVPEAYWYHPLFDEDLDPIPPPVGRVLQ